MSRVEAREDVTTSELSSAAFCMEGKLSSWSLPRFEKKISDFFNKFSDIFSKNSEPFPKISEFLAKLSEILLHSIDLSVRPIDSFSW